jgi:RNA polymerase sigma factor (TIGR02999 family)
LAAAGDEDVTALLLDWGKGNHEALNRLTPLVYDELRQLASRALGRERGDHTLQSTALVHEVYLKLIDQERAQWNDRGHFFAVSSKLIRRILVSHARARNSSKRGGGQTRLLFDDGIALPSHRDVELTALDDAIESLTQFDPQQGRIVELRFFGGLSIEETARILGVSPATIKRDWNVAKAWLYRELSKTEVRK